MKSKCLLPIAVIMCLVLKTIDTKAQKFYAGIGSGYGFSIASQNLSSKIDAGIVQTSNILIKGSFGKGVAFGGYLGYKKNENFATELGVSYLMGNKYRGHYLKELDFNERSVMSANMFRVSPAIKISIGEGKIKSYMKIGVVARVFGKITIKDTSHDIQNNITTETEWKYSNGLSFGMMASLGIIKNVNDKISIFSELIMVNQSWGPKKGIVSKYTVDGVDMLSNLTPYQKQTNFENNYIQTNNSPSASAYPREQLKQYFPFSSLGINIGLHLKFGKS